MALQSVGASNKDDAFYRYKMPVMRTKIESRGNGIVTRIENMADIAKALARPASYITKYFRHKLGATSVFYDKIGASLVHGAHDTAELADLLDIFITKYVQCYGCGNPETEVLVSKTQTVSLNCAACGFVSRVGTGDKIFTKNQPDHKKGGKDKNTQKAEKESLKEGVAAAADGKLKKLKKDAKNKGKTSKGSTDDGHSTSATHDQHGAVGFHADDGYDSDDVQWQTDTSPEAQMKRMQEQLSAVTAGLVMLSTDKPEKKKRAQQKDSTANRYAKLYDKQEVVGTNPYGELVEQIKAILRNSATADQLKAVLSSSTLPSQDVMNSLIEALFDGVQKGFKNEVIKNMEYLTVAVTDDVSQALLLHAIEAFGGKCSTEALKEIPFVLEALYHEDVLEEKTVVQWYNEAVSGGRNSKVLRIAKPFIEWLQNTDCESEEE